MNYSEKEWNMDHREKHDRHTKLLLKDQNCRTVTLKVICENQAVKMLTCYK
jgi:hypothetical protein